MSRTVPPSHSLAGAEIHDHRIRTTLARLLSVDNLPDSHWQQATLRIAEGGLGLGSAQRDRFAAYLGSAADCIRHFVSAFPLLHILVDTWMDEHSTLPVSADLVACTQRVADLVEERQPTSPLPPEVLREFPQSNHQLREAKAKLQHKVTSLEMYVVKRELMQSLNVLRHEVNLEEGPPVFYPRYRVNLNYIFLIRTC